MLRHLTSRVFAVSTIVVTLLLVMSACSSPATAVPEAAALDQMSLEDLMSVEVTSVSKQSEKLFDSAAAVYVISSEDIRRSGAMSIPEALRMAPGLWVAQVDSSKWFVSSRGFGDRFSNKLLVLMDGRCLYTPTFSGVWWDHQDIPMEIIDRIEVIRGPGGTMWGANAVNGVINIITRSPKSGVGPAASTMAGGPARGISVEQYGGQLSADTYYSIYAKQSSWDETEKLLRHPDRWDGWRQSRVGFSAEKELKDGGRFSLQAGTYDGSGDDTFYSGIVLDVPTRYPFEISGTNLLAKWSQNLSPTHGTDLQVYWDHAYGDGLQVRESRDTYDVEYQHRSVLDRHRIIWGAGYRYYTDDMKNSEVLTWTPLSAVTHVANTFIQDEIALRPDRLRLTLGSKLEHNSYTGYEIEPNARLAWTPDERHTLWTSVSRAVRTPSRMERDAAFTFTGVPNGGGPLPTILRFIPNKDFRSEYLTAYELGYRVEPTARFSLDMSTFYNNYTNYRTLETAGQWYLEPFGNAMRIVQPMQFRNVAKAHTYGLEAGWNYRVNDAWRLSGQYTYTKVDMVIPSTSTDVIMRRYEDNFPSHQFNVRSFVDLSKNLELDLMYYRWSRITCEESPLDRLDRLDVRIGWRVRNDLEISFGGQNILHSRHQEAFTSFLDVPGQAYTGYYAKASWQY